MNKPLTELIQELEEMRGKGFPAATGIDILNEILVTIRKILLEQKTTQEKMRQDIDVISRNIGALFRNQDKLINRKLK